MSDYTAVYSDVLDTGREKMSEGDYLKLATFLSSLHKTKEQFEILRETELLIDAKIEFKTNKGKPYDIKIDKCRIIVYRGAKPDDYIVNGSINGEEFVMEKNEFITKFKKIIFICGVKDIKQTIEDNEPEEYTTFKKFKTHCREVDTLINYDSDGENDGSGYDLDWYIACLFGINYEIIRVE